MHSLIVGQTESGKTLLGKLICKRLKESGHKTAVLDPIYDPDWTVDFRCNDADELAKYLRSNRSVYVFVDESGGIFNEGNDNTHSWLATRSRHYGHSVHFLAQRTIQIPKTMRDQCSRLFLFTSSVDDGKLLAAEWNKPVLASCNTLPRFRFYHASRYEICTLMEIRDFNRIVPAGSGAPDDPVPTPPRPPRKKQNPLDFD